MISLVTPIQKSIIKYVRVKANKPSKMDTIYTFPFEQSIIPVKYFLRNPS